MADDWQTPDVEALFEAILRLDDGRRDGALLPRPLHAQRAPRHGPALGGRPDARQRPPLRRDLADDRRQHGDDHPDRLVAQPRRGRLPGDARQARRGVARRHDPLPRRGRPMSRRLRLAIPNKGRLVEPTLRLLHDAGLVFEEHDRSLVALVQNYELDILFVRTNDVIEFVGDGVADLGITGVDLLSETGAELPQFRDARLRPVPARRRGPERHAVPGGRGPGRPARRDGPPEHRPAVLRGSRDRRSRSSRSRARSRSPHGSGSPRRSSTSSRPARRW